MDLLDYEDFPGKWRKRDQKKRPKMKIDGSGVKQVADIIRKKSREAARNLKNRNLELEGDDDED